MASGVAGVGARVCLLVCALLLLGSCAEQRPPINRVQANALDKAFFVGQLADYGDDPEFFMRVSVVDVAAGAGQDGLFTSSDAQPTTRIRWEISEDLLLARLTYELIDGTDGKGVRRTPDGQLAAAYRIVKHFDIRRDYNPSTGEDMNVLVENDSDRPWYERQYFRVDWSQNLVMTAYELDTLAQLGIYYGVSWEPSAYYINDPNHPDAPVFDSERGYFDVTNKVWAKPDVIHDEWWGDFPACWLIGYWPEESCNPSEVTLRQSFLRVTDHDYEPIHWDGTRMDMFGLFTVDRFGYDRRYGVVDDQWRRFASRWNLYERSHAEPALACNGDQTLALGLDPHRDDNGDGSEDECDAIGRGSRCDDVVGLCTVPLRDRTIKPIVWYANRDMPAELYDGTREALASWDDAIRVAVVAGRLAECRRTGEQNCEAQLGWPSPWSDDYVPPVGNSSLAELPTVFVMCHNPVSAELGDAAACGPDGLSPRLGDLRYNIVAVVTEAQIQSPWGIMMDAEDPLSGEKIAGSVNMYSRVLDRASASLTDLVGLLNGNIDPEQYIAGQDISQWVANNQAGAEQTQQAMSAEEITRRRAAFDPHILEPYLAGLGGGQGNVHPKLARQLRAQALVDAGRLGPGNGVLSERLRRLQETALEAQLLTPEVEQLAGYQPGAALGPDGVRRASPFGHFNPSVRRDQQRSARMAQVRRHACRYEGPEPDNLIGLAKLVQQLFPAPDPNDPQAVAAHRQQVYQWARREFTKGVMAHEFGHSMGLRHNFAASFDALNYEPQYWQLRTNNGSATADCPAGTTDGSACIGPRWRDPLSQVELDGDIGRYATTSVMDYPGDQAQDMLLPGKYDRAALRLAYGNTVDVWAEPNVSVYGSGGGQAEAYRLTAFASNPGLFGVYYFSPVNVGSPYEFIHYSQYNNRFGLISQCAASQAPGAINGQSCQQRPLDVVDYRDMSDFVDDPDYEQFDWAHISRAVAPDGRVRRGYLFSSDEYADAGNVPAFTMDAGADAYEQVRFLEGQYENRYVLDAFRRQRVSFNSGDVVWRTQGRYLDNIQQVAKTWAFAALLEGDPAQPDGGIVEDGQYGPLAMSGTVALDLFARILTRPEPGYYCPAEFCYGVQPYGVDVDVMTADPAPLPDIYLYDFRVHVGDGRYLHNDYDYSQGYWWGDYQTQVGAYYDKIWATYYLAEAFDYFISNAKEDFTDSRYKNVNFATIYPEQVRRLYAALLTGDVQTYAPWVVPPPNPPDTPDVTLQYPAWYDKTDIGTMPPNGLLVDPNSAFNEQIYAMVWGTMFFTTNWSSAFVHEARIAALPSETPDWPDAEIYAFSHPATGVTYRAHSSGDEVIMGLTRQRSAGARMLQWANKLLTVAYLVDLDVQGNPIVDSYGRPQLTLDVDGKAQPNPANPGAVATLQAYVDNIDMFRQLIATFEHPLGDGDLPQP